MFPGVLPPAGRPPPGTCAPTAAAESIKITYIKIFLMFMLLYDDPPQMSAPVRHQPGCILYERQYATLNG